VSPYLILENISKRYANKVALKEVNLEIGRKELSAIAGPREPVRLLS